MEREDCLYTSSYCEENIWHLSGDARLSEHDLFVVFISNENRTCALWEQRASGFEGAPVVWDYHVILLARATSMLAYDLDSRLAFPSTLDVYLDATFPYPLLESHYRPVFRVIDVETFRSSFASDRSHMRSDDGWLAPPPVWPCIQPGEATMNLHQFIDMDTPFVGDVLDIEALRKL